MSQDIRIGKHIIGENHPPFIVAEMSGNHNQSIDRALAIVDAAAKAGAHAIKLQTYTSDTMTLNRNDGDFYISDKSSLWHGRALYELYQEAYTPWEWHGKIFDHCKERGILCFSTPFDATSLEFLEKLNPPCYKIASFENTDHDLIRLAAKTKKPLIISTGMANAAEISETVAVARQAGCQDLILLKCTSTYPATPEDTNLRTIPNMRDTFQCEIGLSDHSMGVGVSVASVAFGARFIEKHFTLSRAEGGVDSAFSLEPHELASLVTETLRAWQALGRISYAIGEKEKRSQQFRRTLYVSQDIKKGETISRKNVRAVRPGFGLPIKYFDTICGLKAPKDIPAGTALQWDLLK